jgi:hypothetical protein
MNQPINDGGPAFPHPEIDFEVTIQASSGMTLRDYFAAAALQGMNIDGKFSALIYASDAYQLADAMLKAREVKP